MLFNDHPVTGISSAEHMPGEMDSAFVKSGGELRLSNPGQLELLRGMEERKVPLRTMVRGLSMYPFIRDRDVLTIVPLERRRLQAGEIVAFALPDRDRLAIHRVIAKGKGGWLLRGDNRLASDGIIPQENIIGAVTCIERKGKNVSFGLGPERRLIALLSRAGVLPLMRRAFLLPRQFTASALRLLQGISLYRLCGRRFAPPLSITTATQSENESYQQRFDSYLAYRRRSPNPDVLHLVAKQGAKLYGFARLIHHPEGHAWAGHWIFSLHVRGVYRGLGIGEMLIKHMIDKAREKGAAQLFLAVDEDNKRAISLYQKHNFIRIKMPALEPLLAAEEEKTGRRRILMGKRLS